MDDCKKGEKGRASANFKTVVDEITAHLLNGCSVISAKKGAERLKS